MRLDFNIVLVDDDKNDTSNRSRGVMRLKQLVENHIRKKGFKPFIIFESSSVPILNLGDSEKKRIDLFLSDNNLSNNSHEANKNESDGGIELYLKLKHNFICDFILYSRSDKSTIVRKLIEDLDKNQNPNLFSRFSFVERNSTNDEWINEILLIIDHIVTKREELNNLRGIFAQVISRLHHKMVVRYNIPSPQNKKLADSLDYAHRAKKITDNDFAEFSDLKNIRNGLLHNDEIVCPTRSIRCIEYQKAQYSQVSRAITETTAFIYEDDDFDIYRKRLFNIYDRFK